jgi:hypothetical protein
MLKKSNKFASRLVVRLAISRCRSLGRPGCQSVRGVSVNQGFSLEFHPHEHNIARTSRSPLSTKSLMRYAVESSKVRSRSAPSVAGIRWLHLSPAPRGDRSQAGPGARRAGPKVGPADRGPAPRRRDPRPVVRLAPEAWAVPGPGASPRSRVVEPRRRPPPPLPPPPPLRSPPPARSGGGGGAGAEPPPRPRGC